jgi:glycosyltransferase involved in cell wall biosynthesis
MLKIVTNCGPCEDYIGRSIASIRSQSLTEWEAYVTVDPCGDRTYERAVLARDGDPRIHIRHNRVRRFAMENLVRAIRGSGAEPEDVIAVLDGDDWFATADALRVIQETYRRHQCWMTYGSWVADRTDLPGLQAGRWPAYPEGTTDFRNAEWLGTAVRTWKRWLWGLIDQRDLRDAQGRFYRVTEDQAVMMPMLEMSGTGRARHIEEVLMVYNRSSPHACGLTRCEEMLANSRHIRTLPAYGRLAEVPGSGALRKMQQCCIS